MIEVENLYKEFSLSSRQKKELDTKEKTSIAVDDVSFTCQPGRIFSLLGPNGAGKTSLIRIINQITAPDSGNVYINGEKLNREHISIIGYLPEERGLYKKMKVGEQAMYLAQLKGMTKKAVDKYNLEKPHSALGRVSPVRYEELLTKNPLIDKRKKEAKKEKYFGRKIHLTERV